MDAPVLDEELDELHSRLERARCRERSATRGGPEWDAAMDEITDLEAQLAAAMIRDAPVA